MERSLLEVEGYLSDFADDHPDVVVSRLRFSNVLGPDLDTPLSKALRLPVVPEIFGFDPRLQFTHQDDVLGALCFTARHDVPGIFNVAGDGTAALERRLPPRRPAPGADPPAGDGRGRRGAAPPRDRRPAARAARACCASAGASTTAGFKDAGYRYRYTSAGTVEDFARSLRLRSTVGDRPPAYRYDPGVEEFFRRSPAVVNRPTRSGASPRRVIAPRSGRSSIPPWRSATWWYGTWSPWGPPTPWPRQPS